MLSRQQASPAWQALQGGSYVLIDLNAEPDGVPCAARGMAAGFTVTGHLTAAQLNAIYLFTIGLSGMPDDVGNWATLPGSASIASEALAVVSAAGLGRFR